MEPKLLLYALLLWALFIPFAIVNAGVREIIVAPRLGDHAGHVISTVIFVVVLLFAIYAFLRFVGVSSSPADLWLLGILWLVLTVLFEFGFGHYVMGNSWEALLHDYNLLAGRVWVLIPLTWLLAPPIIGWLVHS